MLVGTLRLPDEQFLEFIERVKPEIVVMGAFGAPQWAAQEDPRAWLEEWQAVFQRMHRSHVKVIGMIELLNVGNNPDEAKSFIDFYDNRWDEQLLGARPPAKAIELLERRSMTPEKQVGAHAPRGCAINPHWRTLEKALVKAFIDAGIDGFITHRNMFGECGCPFCRAEFHPHTNSKRERQKHEDPSARTLRVGAHDLPCDHCQQGFRRWLADRYDVKQLASRFHIADLNTYRLPAIYGHHREHERLPSPIELEGMKYARHAIKECYDDVFVHFGRSVNRDLIVAQWNHMPYFDEMHLDSGHIPRLSTAKHDGRSRGAGYDGRCESGSVSHFGRRRYDGALFRVHATSSRDLCRGQWQERRGRVAGLSPHRYPHRRRRSTGDDRSRWTNDDH
jgi:hypothetical protein